jgi:hypothetical protein
MESHSPRLNLSSPLKTFFILFISPLFLFAAFTEVQASSWKKVNKYGPSDRYSYGAAYDSTNKFVLIFGGKDGPGNEYSDFWKWDGVKWSKIIAVPNPSFRQEHAMAYDSNRKVLVLFGGWQSGSTNSYKKDTWEWDGKSWKEIKKKGPSARSIHSMVYDSKRTKIVLFGGLGTNGILGDTWTYDSKGWKKVASNGPPGLYLHSMAYDAKHDLVVLFGGYSDQGYNGDTWVWDGSKWIKVSQTGPSARMGAGMDYDASSGVVVLFGGIAGYWPNYVYYADTWVWNGKKWTRLKISGPSQRAKEKMVYNEQAKNIFLFGGDDPNANSALRDSWIFTYKK